MEWKTVCKGEFITLAHIVTKVEKFHNGSLLKAEAEKPVAIQAKKPEAP